MLWQPFSNAAVLVWAMRLNESLCIDGRHSASPVPVILDIYLYELQIGGISTRELNKLELEMLKLLGFRCFVSQAELSEVLSQLIASSLGSASATEQSEASRQSKKRGNEEPAADISLPAKLQHDSHNNQIIVTSDFRDCVRQESEELSTVSVPSVALMCHTEERQSSGMSQPIQVQLGISAGGK